MPAVPRRRMHPGQKRMLWATIALFLGAFLPWLYTPVGTVSGIGVGDLMLDGQPGAWVLYASFAAMAAALAPWRTFSVVNGFLVAAIAIGLPLYHLWRMWERVGFEGWMPGPGIVMSLAGGALCFIGARELRTLAEAPAGAAPAR